MNKQAPNPGANPPHAEEPDARGQSATAPAQSSTRVLPQSTPATVWKRIKDHKVVQWTLAYVAAAYTLLHGVEMVGNALDWPHLVVRVVTLLLFLGLPVTTTLAWYHGHRAQHRVSGPELAIITVLLVIAGSVLWFFGHPNREHATRLGATEAHVSGEQAFPTAVTPPEKSIAVLPFSDMSEKRDQGYFSDGLSEELIDQLGRVPDLRVSARTSSFYFKDRSEDIPTIAQRLRVANVLEGSVRKAGNTLRVTVQLIRADSGYHIWSNSYDRDLKDIFKVQDEIAAAVVAALRLKLAPGPQGSGTHRTDNTEAYDQYLLGRQLFNRRTSDGFLRANDAYHKAIALDPNYAAAYAGLAYAEYFRADDVGDPAGLHRAEAAAEKAVALAPDQPDGYEARGFLRFTLNWDWNGAQADIEKALAIDAGNSTTVYLHGQLLGALGRQAEAVVAANKAIDLDPLSGPAWVDLGRSLAASGQFAAAHAALRRALDVNPESIFALRDFGRLQLAEGNAAAALVTFKQVDHPTVRLFGTAAAEHSLGHEKESQRALKELIETRAQDPYQVAEVYAWRGEKDKCFEWLGRAYLQRDGGLSDIKRDPLLTSIRSDPRYKAFLQKMQLPE